MLDLKLRGRIVTMSPVNVLAHSDDDNQQRGFMTTPYFSDGGLKRVPAIRGRTIKGMFRHASSRIVMDAMAKADGRPLTNVLKPADTFWTLLGGVADGEMLKKTPDVALIDRIKREHPIMGLYGACEPCFIGGNAQFKFAISPPANGLIYPDRQNSVRKDPLLSDEKLAMATDQTALGAYMAQFPESTRRSKLRGQERDIDARLKKLLRDSSTEAAGQRTTLEAEKKRVSAEIAEITASVGNSVRHIIATTYAIPAGVPLGHGISCFGVTEDQAGLLLRTLCSFADDCRIGGFATVGYGDVRFEYEIQTRAGRGNAWTSCGTIAVEDGDVAFDEDHPGLAPLLSAWKRREESPGSIPRSSFAYVKSSNMSGDDADA